MSEMEAFRSSRQDLPVLGSPVDGAGVLFSFIVKTDISHSSENVSNLHARCGCHTRTVPGYQSICGENGILT